MARQLLLARHAETGPELTGKYIGATDVPLAGRGPDQAVRLAGYLNGFKPGACFVSPMLRTRQTAQACSRDYGLTFQEDGNLREIDFGRWEGLDFQHIAAQDPELVEEWSRNPGTFRFPAGESGGDFQHRVATACDSLCRQEADTVLAVTHGGVIRVMLCRLLGLAPRHYHLFAIKPATVTVVDLYDQGGILSGLNLGPGEAQ